MVGEHRAEEQGAVGVSLPGQQGLHGRGSQGQDGLHQGEVAVGQQLGVLPPLPAHLGQGGVREGSGWNHNAVTVVILNVLERSYSLGVQAPQQ